ncbi:MAG: hypothetical protein KBC11_01800 [Candidatus Pacebacteria bacterium]|nr:hypothetical protein [Candidatus Paceibacterota bacterium]
MVKKNVQIMKFNSLKSQILHDIGGFLRQSNSEKLPNFSTYDNVRFCEYRISEEECITVGFHHRDDDEINVLLLNQCISSIKESIEAQDNKVNTPFVFTIKLKEVQKHRFCLHPDKGYFIRIDLLKGHLLKVFDVIVSVINNTNSYFTAKELKKELQGA